MKTFDLLLMSVHNLTRRAFRTAMTVLGVVIGTLAIVVMISLGIGVNQSYSDFLSSMGDLTVIEVYEGAEKIDDTTLSTFLAMEGVKTATPFIEVSLFGDQYYETFLSGGKNNRYRAYGGNLVGINSSALIDLDYKIIDGQSIVPNSKKIQVLVGSGVAYSFEDTKREYPNNYINNYPDPVTGEVAEPFLSLSGDENQLTFSVVYDEDKSLTYDVEVVGTIVGPENDWASTYGIFMDVQDVQIIYNDVAKVTKKKDAANLRYSMIKVKVSELEMVSTIVDEIEDMLYYAYSLEDQRQDAMQQTQMLQLILGSLGGISLFVAAISIANTMVMTVYERTREIGIMKVLGCYVSDIRKTFLVEASMIGFAGGLLGVLLSYFLSFLLNRYGGSIGEALGVISMEGTANLSIIPPWLALLGLAFATCIGIVSGLYPAYRAVKISALEAIKQE